MDKYLDKIIEMAADYAPKFVLAVVTLIIGLWIVRLMTKGINRIMVKKEIDESLRPFLSSIFNILLKVLLIVSVLSMVGIAMTSFVAILAAAGLAVGMALSGTLQNFAGGVMILIFKPFKVGDYIAAQGHEGTVEEILIFITKIKSIDNKIIIIPNGPLSNNDVVNFTAESLRRVDLTFGIGYSDDIDKARTVIESVINKNEKILKDPSSQVIVSELADSSVNFISRTWCATEDYWDVYFYMQEEIKKAFDQNSISIPFPQRDVHIHQVK